MKLVRINVKNVKELGWLHRFIHSYHSSPKWVLPTKNDLKNPAYRYFRALNERGDVVGMTSYEIRTPFLVETQKTIVDPKFRGQGLGKELSLAIERQVRKDGYKKIRTTIYTTNLAMIGIKLAQGFKIEGYHPDHDAPGLDEYSLGKILTKRRGSR